LTLIVVSGVGVGDNVPIEIVDLVKHIGSFSAVHVDSIVY
jgi:hypothetical protein